MWRDDDQAFQQAIADAPDDTTLRFVYADWLEERDDARGEYLRLLMVLEDRTTAEQWPTVLARLRELYTGIDANWLEQTGRCVLRRRRPLWEGMGDLFIDNEPSYMFTAEKVRESEYRPDHVRWILWCEVFPAIEVNLRHPAGEWVGFPADWMQNLVLGPTERQAPDQQPSTASIIRNEWPRVCRYLPAEFWVCEIPWPRAG